MSDAAGRAPDNATFTTGLTRSFHDPAAASVESAPTDGVSAGHVAGSRALHRPAVARGSDPARPHGDRFGLNVPHEWWPSGAAVESPTRRPASAGCSSTRPRPRSSPTRGSCIAACAGHRRGALHHRARGGRARARRPSRRHQVRGRSPSRACSPTRPSVGAEPDRLPRADGRRGARTAQDRSLAEARSLAALARVAERIGVTIALENLAPVYPGPGDRLGEPALLSRARSPALNSPAVGLCLDVGHAQRRRRPPPHLAGPADRAGPRPRQRLPPPRQPRRPAAAAEQRPGVDPLRLDLHLPPGRGTINWFRVVRCSPRPRRRWCSRSTRRGRGRPSSPRRPATARRRDSPLRVLDDDALDAVAGGAAAVDAGLQRIVDVLPAEHEHRVDRVVEQRGESVAVEPVALALELRISSRRSSTPLEPLEAVERRGERAPLSRRTPASCCA